MTDRLRAGIIGTGFIGTVHAHAVRASGATVATVAASTPRSAIEAAERLGAAAAETAEALIDADDVDIVHICTPNDQHLPLARRALAAGKHVICEKPLATRLEDARMLTTHAAERTSVATVPFVYRYYPSVREARARIAAGNAGALRLLHGSYLQDWLADPAATNWRVDPAVGGTSRAFADIGVHWCDLMEFVTGHRITRLAARMIRSAGRTTEDGATVLFDTDRGASGSLVVSQISPGRKNRLWFSLDGERASYSFDQEAPEHLWIGTATQNLILPRGADAQSEQAQRYSVLPPGHPQGYQDCFNAFVADTYAAVRGDRRDGLPTFVDGLRAAAISDAVIRSAATENWEEIAA
jgi:predicted dehydrogenase